MYVKSKYEYEYEYEYESESKDIDIIGMQFTNKLYTDNPSRLCYKEFPDNLNDTSCSNAFIGTCLKCFKLVCISKFIY